MGGHVATRITGLSLRATIGLAFAAVIVLIAIASAVTFSFQSKSADLIGELKGRLDDNAKQLDDSKEKVQAFLSLDKSLKSLDELQMGLSSTANKFAAIQTRVREVGDQCVDENRSTAERMAFLRALFVEQEAGKGSEFEQATSATRQGIAVLEANVTLNGDAKQLSEAVDRFQREVNRALMTKVARTNNRGEVVSIDEVSIFEAKHGEDDLADAVDATGSSLRLAFARIRADEPKDAAGNALPSVSRLVGDLTQKIQDKRLDISKNSKESSEALDAAMGNVSEGMAKVASEMKAAQDAAGLPNTVMVLVTIVVTVLAIIATFWTSWMVSRPLRQLAQAAKQVTSGDLSASIETSRTDEVGELAEAFSTMVAEMNEILHEAQRVAEQVAKSAEVLSSSASGVMSQMDRQAEGISEASGLVEGVRGRSEAIRDHASGASHASDQVMTHSNEGKAVVTRTRDQMVQVSSTVSDSAKIIDALGAASQEIGNIVSTISEIADQTNLLALNAAIEAARAGEHGRGFAVVADEVRKLAVNVSKSANEIIELISRFKNETERAVTSMQEGARVVKAGVASANQAGASLDTIVDAVRRVSDLMLQTDEATHDQVRATGEVRDTLGDLTKLSVAARDVAHRTAEEAAEMQTAVGNLQSLLSHFRLGRRAGTREVKGNIARRRRARASEDRMDTESADRGAVRRDADGGLGGADAGPQTVKLRRSGRLTQAIDFADADGARDKRDRRDSDRRVSSGTVETERRSGPRRGDGGLSDRGRQDRRTGGRRKSARDGSGDRRRR